MRNWALLFGVAAALGSAVVVTVLLTRRAGGDGEEAVPEIIADCFDRIHRIESELRRLKPDVEALG
jgi:hypothetical protein